MVWLKTFERETCGHIGTCEKNKKGQKIRQPLTEKPNRKMKTTVLNRDLARLLNSKWVDIKEIIQYTTRWIKIETKSSAGHCIVRRNIVTEIIWIFNQWFQLGWFSGFQIFSREYLRSKSELSILAKNTLSSREPP